MIKSYKDLIVWQKSIDLVKEVYGISSKLPKEEKFGLAGQMKRAAVSIASNIAEGNQRSGGKDFSNFLRMSKGSLAELETQLIIAQDLFNEIDTKRAFELIEEVGKMLSTMIRKLENSNN